MTGREGAGTPGTEAGRRLVTTLKGAPAVVEFVLAIEAEAARSERERIVRAVEGLPNLSQDDRLSLLDRDAILARLRDEP